MIIIIITSIIVIYIMIIVIIINILLLLLSSLSFGHGNATFWIKTWEHKRQTALMYYLSYIYINLLINIKISTSLISLNWFLAVHQAVSRIRFPLTKTQIQFPEHDPGATYNPKHLSKK